MSVCKKLDLPTRKLFKNNKKTREELSLGCRAEATRARGLYSSN